MAKKPSDTIIKFSQLVYEKLKYNKIDTDFFY